MPFVLIWLSTLYTWADVSYCKQEISFVSMCQLKVTCIKIRMRHMPEMLYSWLSNDRLFVLLIVKGKNLTCFASSLIFEKLFLLSVSLLCKTISTATRIRKKNQLILILGKTAPIFSGEIIFNFYWHLFIITQ